MQLTPQYKTAVTSTQKHVRYSFNLIQRTLSQLTQQAWFAYVMLLSLQLKVTWGMWQVRDLPIGDAMHYFADAQQWHTSHTLSNLAWSPLYVLFYGSLFDFSENAYWLNIGHRLIILFTASFLVLAVMRRLLPHVIAWGVSAWWVLLPVNFDPLYTVHLFAVIPTLFAVWLVAWRPSVWTRSGSLFILLASAFCVRGELILAALMWGCVCFAYDIWQTRKSAGNMLASLGPYAIALSLVAVVIAGFIAQLNTSKKVSDVLSSFSQRQKTAFCQHYAVGYAQRHPEWDENPWLNCQKLMTGDFDQKSISELQAFRANPQAVSEHVFWNIRLLPNAAQYMLFNAISGEENPDVVRIDTEQPHIFWQSILVVVINLLGAILLWRTRAQWRVWFQENAWGWICLFLIVMVALVVAVAVRPRSSYLYSFSIGLMALTGMSLFILAVVVGKRLGINQLPAVTPLIMVSLVLLTPSYYSAKYRDQVGYNGRTVYEAYQRLLPYQEMFAARHGSKIAVPQYQVCGYLQVPDSATCHAYGFHDQEIPLPQDMTAAGVQLFYLDATVFNSPAGKSFLELPGAENWHLIALANWESSVWQLYQRDLMLSEDVAALQALNAKNDLGPANNLQSLYRGQLPSNGLFIGNNWHSLEQAGDELYRWVDNNAEIVITDPTGEPPSFFMEIEPGPSLNYEPFVLQIIDETGQVVAEATVLERQKITFDLPLKDTPLGQVFRLHIPGSEPERQPPDGDTRVLSFRVIEIGFEDEDSRLSGEVAYESVDRSNIGIRPKMTSPRSKNNAS